MAHIILIKLTPHRRHAAVLGVSMMIMGDRLQEIQDRSVDRYMQMISRDELRKAQLERAEKLKEIYSLIFAFAVFSVLLSFL